MSNSNEIFLSSHGKYLRTCQDNTRDINKWDKSGLHSLVAISKAASNQWLRSPKDLNLLRIRHWCTEINSRILFLFCKLIMEKITITCVSSACDFITRIYFLCRYLEKYCGKHFIFVKTFSFMWLFNYSQKSTTFHLNVSFILRGCLLGLWAASQCCTSHHLGHVLSILVRSELYSLPNHQIHSMGSSIQGPLKILILPNWQVPFVM